ncbi:hypothetical protein BCR32DRAFT_244907 [Anaeromyces robustus]|uniref:Uncharacterized protein n=1 Tax=Anaeromyces robustus TaxID=1754192 RepID=A0A1Y1X6K1_9FUNG|nr:hypothetical protein BCR32DRAFT_244907 [Anaeromyces robustus]|eukprot:ORX81419.1 hypothetical protein BCR32DRAFT_244907 [Anaeromyces robustus]
MKNIKKENIKKENNQLKIAKIGNDSINRSNIKIRSVRAISDSFSLICFRRKLKTNGSDLSFFERHYNLYENKKPNDFLYYFNIFFDGENFNSKFQYRINFNKFPILLDYNSVKG